MAGVIVNFLFALVAGNYCGSEIWGRYSLCLTVLNISGVFSRIGLDFLSVRLSAEAYPAHPGKIKDIFIKSSSLIFLSSSIASFTLFLFSNNIADLFFHNPGLSHPLRLISLAILPLNFLLLNSEILKGIKKPLGASFFQNAIVLLIALPVLIVALNYWKTDAVTETYVIAITLSAIISFSMWIKVIPFYSINRDRWFGYRSLLKQGLPLMLSNSLINLMIWTDTLMLGVFRSEAEVGIYNVAFRISMLMIIPLGAVSAVTAPEIAIFNSKNDRAGLQNIVDKANRLIFWITFPMAAIIVLFSSPLLGIFGSEFSTGNISLIILVAGRMFFCLCGIRGVILPMLGKQKVEQYISMSVVIIDIILNLIFVPRWGINGAALSTMTTTIIWTVITVVYLRKSMKLNALYIPFAGRLLSYKNNMDGKS